MLEDEILREREGREIEIIALATQKAKDDLSTLHQYQDGKLDLPFLTPESALKNRLDNPP